MVNITNYEFTVCWVPSMNATQGCREKSFSVIYSFLSLRGSVATNTTLFVDTVATNRANH